MIMNLKIKRYVNGWFVVEVHAKRVYKLSGPYVSYPIAQGALHVHESELRSQV